jgi:hypothetical protein
MISSPVEIWVYEGDYGERLLRRREGEYNEHGSMVKLVQYADNSGGKIETRIEWNTFGNIGAI